MLLRKDGLLVLRSVRFVAGYLELSFSSMTQTLVQLNAPGGM